MANNEFTARSRGADVSLWIGSLGGGAAWLLHLLLSYGVAEFGCVSGLSEVKWMGISAVAWLEAGVSLVSLALAIAVGVVAQRSHRRIAEAAASQPSDSVGARVFMAQSGVLASRLFVFIILVQSIPFLFYLRDC